MPGEFNTSAGHIDQSCSAAWEEGSKSVLEGIGEFWANRERPETGDRTAEAGQTANRYRSE